MLDPYQRQNLLTALRPPDGFQLDRAIGTTFSLDLLTLLTVPLAFTFHGAEVAQDDNLQDPLALLDGVRRYAERIVIFCQAGQIAIPKASQQLFNYLEDRVFEVAPVNYEEAVFHPKVWLLRYVTAESGIHDSSPHYRLLCLSRNLTFDRSWDTILSLDGVLTDRNNAYSRNHPLGDFFAALPEMVVRPDKVPTSIRDVVIRLQDEVRRVDFEIPWPFKDMRFVAMGLTGRKKWPFIKRASRQLVMSPFISPEFLSRFSQSSGKNTLISRLDNLMSLSAPDLAQFEEVYMLSEEADPEDEDEQRAGGNDNETSLSNESLSGLHAKLFISETGWDATLWTGSANATSAAFHRNVEFLVQLTGRKSKIGIDQLLARDGQDEKRVRFSDLLVPFNPNAEPMTHDPLREKLEAEATSLRRRLARLSLIANVSVIESDNSQLEDKGTEQYEILIQQNSNRHLQVPEHITLRCWPITLQQSYAVPVNTESKNLAFLRPISFVALTSFYAFEATAADEGAKVMVRFVLNIPLRNEPVDRRERVFRSLLDNRNKVLAYLLFLMAEEGNYGITPGLSTKLTSDIDKGAGVLPLGGTLFESLVITLQQHPEKLDHIKHLVDDLKASGNVNLLPEGFDTIWLPIWEAREHLKKQGTNDL